MKLPYLALGAAAVLISTAAGAQTTPAPQPATPPQELTGCFVKGDTLKVTLKSGDGAPTEYSVGGSDLLAAQIVALCAVAPSTPTPPLVQVGFDATGKTVNSVAVYRR